MPCIALMTCYYLRIILAYPHILVYNFHSNMRILPCMPSRYQNAYIVQFKPHFPFQSNNKKAHRKHPKLHWLHKKDAGWLVLGCDTMPCHTTLTVDGVVVGPSDRQPANVINLEEEMDDHYSSSLLNLHDRFMVVINIHLQ